MHLTCAVFSRSYPLVFKLLKIMQVEMRAILKAILLLNSAHPSFTASISQQQSINQASPVLNSSELVSLFSERVNSTESAVNGTVGAGYVRCANSRGPPLDFGSCDSAWDKIPWFGEAAEDTVFKHRYDSPSGAEV